MSTAALEATLAARGWVVVDLPDSSPVLHARERLLARLRDTALPGLRCLDDYHWLVDDDERHIEILHGLMLFFWEAELGRAVIASNLELFRHLVGLDLHIQRCPYLRAVRPGKPRDAAPLHRDTYYGASAHEVSVLVPLTDMGAEGVLRVISGSHVSPDSAYPYVQQVSPEVAIRSPKHQLGFPYAPRLLDPLLVERAEPVPLAMGQALVFGLSLVHGHGVNAGSRTRFSTDIRVVNSLVPVPRDRGVHDDYYVPLCSSAVSLSAQRYLAAN
ncbi:MAG TPA: phytanoyl-CoA dioxygenase family protein, partial [Methylomirabilota bacterium]